MILVDAQGLEAHRPGRPLFDNLSVTLSSGDRLAVVGLNGCGKSTLLRQLSGAEEPAGGVVRRGRGSRVAVLDQDADATAGDATLTVAEAVSGDWEGEAILERLGIGALRDRTVASLSGGQAKRVALARTLVEVGQVGHGDDAVLLILDEPTNHLDVDAIAWLEERLAQHRGGLLLVTHDRHMLDRVTNRILEIDRGHSYVHEGGYASYLLARAERDEKAAVAEDVRQNLARRELAWLRRGAKARSRKSKSRVTSATALIERSAEPDARPGSLELSAAAGGTTKGSGGLAGYTEAAARRRSGVPRLGEKVIELEGVGHRFDDGQWLFRGVELSLDPGERLAILGPNGAGKSTLSDIMAGRLTPTEGTVSIGPTVVLGVHRQQGPEIDPTLTVREAVAGPHRQPDHDDARLMEQFWFDTDVQHAPVGLLSGGERRRLQLLLTLAQRPNVLILDEPTNDLDLDTLRVLEDYLDDWPGAVVMVSHDRTFLERTVTDAVSLADGRLKRVPGGVAAWAAERRVAPRPRRLASTTTAVQKDAASDPRPESPSVAPPDTQRSDPSNASSSPVTDQVETSTQPMAPDAAPTGQVPPDVGRDVTTQTTSDSKSSRPSGAGEKKAPQRSASTLRFLLKDVDRDLRRLQRRRNELTTALADATASGDHVTLAEVGRELAVVEGELSTVEERWIELSLEAES